MTVVPLAGTPLVPSASSVRRRAGGIGVGIVTLWLSVIVLLPIAALVVGSLGEGPAAFVEAISTPSAVAALAITLALALIVTLVNAVMGTVIAWVLVRDLFPGKKVVDALIDLPFALPTIVASVVLLALYGPNSPVGIQLNNTKLGVLVALAFVTLPFVVRSVQPVLIEADREVEEAARSLGAGEWTTFRTVVWPTIRPAVIGGAGLAFARAIGEYGSVTLIGGNIQRQTQVASQYIQDQIEVDNRLGAAAVSVTLLALSFAVLCALRFLANRRSGHPEEDTW